MFQGHILTVEAEGDYDAFQDLIHLIETQAPYMLDNVIVKSVINRDGSAEAMGETARLVFPTGSFAWDNGDQAILYTNTVVLTSEENPSIPAGESIVQEYNYDPEGY